MFTAAVLSFAVGLVLTPVARALARRFRLVDNPDGRRKLHDRAIPVAGGPVLLAACAVGVAAALARGGPLADEVRLQAPCLAGLLVACLVVCAVGVADDFAHLRGRYKLLGQLAAVTIVITSGVQVRTVHLLGQEFELGLVAVPFTAFILLGAINSLNLLDGMDGLLSSLAFIICLALGTMAWLAGRDATACIAFVLAGALLAFLVFNFPPASIFLGDSGSMLIGLTVGVLAIHSSLKGPTTAALATPLALLALPIFDTTAAILRRKLTGQSIYATDRGHLHHCLLRRLSHPRRVLVVTSLCCLVLVAGVFAGMLLQNEVIALGTALTMITLLVATRLFGHAEFLLIKTRLSRLLAWLLRPHGEGQDLRMDLHLHGSSNWEALLDAVAARALDLNLQTIRLAVSAPALAEEYHGHWDRAGEEEDEEQLWRAEIPLVLRGRTVGRLQVSGRPDPLPLGRKVAALTEILTDFAKSYESAAPAAVALNGEGAEDAPPPPAVRCPLDDSEGAHVRA